MDDMEELAERMVQRERELFKTFEETKTELLRIRGVLRALGQTPESRVSKIAARWETVDWSKTNNQIAEEMDVSRERVRQVRVSLGMADPADKHKSKRTIAVEEWIKANMHLSGTVTLRQVHEMIGVDAVSRQWLFAKLGQAGFTFKKNISRSRKQSMNWQINNRLLASIWKMTTQEIASWRWNKRLGPAKWAKEVLPEHDKELAKAIEIEKQRAARWLATGNADEQPQGASDEADEG